MTMQLYSSFNKIIKPGSGIYTQKINTIVHCSPILTKIQTEYAMRQNNQNLEIEDIVKKENM